MPQGIAIVDFAPKGRPPKGYATPAWMEQECRFAPGSLELCSKESVTYNKKTFKAFVYRRNISVALAAVKADPTRWAGGHAWYGVWC
jgi:hypothetical protein